MQINLIVSFLRMKQILQKITSVNGDISENLKGCRIQQDVTGINPQEIITLATLLKSSTSKGVDGISCKIIQEIIAEIAELLSVILNLSL